MNMSLNLLKKAKCIHVEYNVPYWMNPNRGIEEVTRIFVELEYTRVIQCNKKDKKWVTRDYCYPVDACDESEMMQGMFSTYSPEKAMTLIEKWGVTEEIYDEANIFNLK